MIACGVLLLGWVIICLIGYIQIERAWNKLPPQRKIAVPKRGLFQDEK